MGCDCYTVPVSWSRSLPLEHCTAQHCSYQCRKVIGAAVGKLGAGIHPQESLKLVVLDPALFELMS